MLESNGVKFVPANIVTAFHGPTIGSKVVDLDRFIAALATAVQSHDFSTDRVPGQGSLLLPADAFGTVSCGVGKRSDDPSDYVIRMYRGRVNAYLKRPGAATVESLEVVVYTKAAYLAVPSVAGQADEITRVNDSNAEYVIVAILAGAGPKAPLTPHRFVSNLAGGNREAAEWSADEIRAKAGEIIAYDDAWCVVAD
jgi:hypothetical protein